MKLAARGLGVCAGRRVLLEGVDLAIATGEMVVVAGPSGSGKSVLLRSILGLLPFAPGLVHGEILVDGEVSPPPRLRGETVGIVAQDGRGSLDPLSTVGALLRRVAALSPTPGAVDAALRRVGFDDPARVAALYPHELSGGMAQRVAIAAALARGSRFLLCDEPTTGLDPHVQVEILTLLRGLNDRGVVFVTHDLDLVDGACDSVLVLEEGRVVDRAPRPSALAGAGRALWDATQSLRRRRA